MHIRIEVKSNNYIYLWLKYITGFDINSHCAKCLIGKYSKLIQYRSQKVGKVYEGELNEHDAPYVYLCGVTKVYENNLHIACMKDERVGFEYEDSNVRVSIEGARQLAITPLVGELFPVQQSTCRNFQFGYHYLRDGIEETAHA